MVHEARDVARRLRGRLHERDHLAALDLQRDDARVLARIAADRPRARDHLVEDDADGVEIRARVDPVRAARLLGRHVLGRPHHDAGHGEVLLLRVEPPRLGDPEVDELEDGPAAGERHEDVLGLQDRDA